MFLFQMEFLGGSGHTAVGGDSAIVKMFIAAGNTNGERI